MDPATTGDQSPITNENYREETAEAPEDLGSSVERAWLYRPEDEWTYSHHPHLAFFNGRFFAMWSNGRRDEDAPGQRVLYSTSADFRSWSEPGPLLGPLAGRDAEFVLTAAGFHSHAGRLIAYIGAYEYRPESLDQHGTRPRSDRDHMNTTLFALTTGDGETWADPIDLHLPIVPNFGPQPTASGRLIISGNISFPYTDDPTGLSGWRMTGIYPSSQADSIVDDSESFKKLYEVDARPVATCEGAFYQTDDDVLHMLLRTNTDRLWVTESADDGLTWSEPRSTGFSDNATKFHFGRLPKGRYYYVGSPDPQPRGKRERLILSLSDEGVRFDRHLILANAGTPYEPRAEGMHKGGDYGYPHTLVHEGALHVIVSRRKEAIEVRQIAPEVIRVLSEKP
jgi:hypothetical protein